jgi:hypothetical protein
VAPGLSIAFAIAAGIFGLAYVVAPKSCEGGNEIYFWTGVVAVIAWLALPFAMKMGKSLAVRFALAFGFAAVGIGVWLGGMTAAHVQILCRLF